VGSRSVLGGSGRGSTTAGLERDVGTGRAERERRQWRPLDQALAVLWQAGAWREELIQLLELLVERADRVLRKPRRRAPHGVAACWHLPGLQVQIGHMGKGLIRRHQGATFAEGMAGDQQIHCRQRLPLAFEIDPQPAIDPGAGF